METFAQTSIGKVGKNIRKIRELKNISPKDMAEKMEMSLSGYQRIERDEVTIGTDRISQVAEILKVSPGQIFDFNEDRIIFNQTNEYGHNGYIINNEFTPELKKAYEDIATSKDQTIATQAKTIEALLKTIEFLEAR